MNIYTKLNQFFFTCSITLLLLVLTGCNPYLNFTNTLPSEYNLEGVSKIALVEFNSLPDDPVTGVYTVDDETKKIVKDMISTVFFKGKTYKIANLNAENTILKSGKISNVALAQRFDAILYGRIWWKTTPEYKNITPKVYNLEKWYYERYVCGLTSGGYPIYSRARLTDYTREVMREHKYRAKNATLMLSLTLYKIKRNGEIEKIVEDFAAADQNYLLLNGDFSTSFVPHYENKLSQLELINLQSEDKNEKKKIIEKELAGFIDKNQNATTTNGEIPENGKWFDKASIDNLIRAMNNVIGQLQNLKRLQLDCNDIITELEKDKPSEDGNDTIKLLNKQKIDLLRKFSNEVLSKAMSNIGRCCSISAKQCQKFNGKTEDDSKTQ